MAAPLLMSGLLWKVKGSIGLAQWLLSSDTPSGQHRRGWVRACVYSPERIVPLGGQSQNHGNDLQWLLSQREGRILSRVTVLCHSPWSYAAYHKKYQTYSTKHSDRYGDWHCKKRELSCYHAKSPERGFISKNLKVFYNLHSCREIQMPPNQLTVVNIS